MEIRKEKIIEILKEYLPPDGVTISLVNPKSFYNAVAGAILALPIDVPGEEEMQEWVNKDKKSLIDYEVYTMSELKERLIGRFEGAKWAINEIIERNK